MLFFFRRRGAAKKGEKRRDLPDVSQPAPLTRPPIEDDSAESGVTVTELSEMEARVLCAREDIPVFWSRPDKEKKERKG
ncbi:hypothetical protein [Variovorax sp. KK3]|uniref:hypothetical protein n=1 Tax=Variovorax sp. KK3 TaxID=1855728 RepID=UPI00097C4E75|nr:hypothetical protein [Variovorax sp. KK3]